MKACDIHVYSPSPEMVLAEDDFDCPVPDRLGQKCGSYRMVFEVFYGWSYGTCCACGARFDEEGWARGSKRDAERARDKWAKAREK